MILAVDIGNSHIVIGGIQDGRILFRARLVTEDTKTSDQYMMDIKNLCDVYGVSRQDVEGTIIASVVPQVLNSMQSAVRKYTGKSAMTVGPGIKTGLNILLENPAQMGADLVVADVAALREYTPPLILIDMGTATTFGVIDRKGAHIGGCVCPGVRVSLNALTEKAALLPAIQIDRPKRVIGRNTAEAMRSGVMFGTACMIDGMIDRIEEELGFGTTVVATGSMAQFVTPLCRHKILYDKDLILKGLAILYRENTRRMKP